MVPCYGYFPGQTRAPSAALPPIRVRVRVRVRHELLLLHYLRHGFNASAVFQRVLIVEGFEKCPSNVRIICKVQLTYFFVHVCCNLVG